MTVELSSLDPSKFDPEFATETEVQDLIDNGVELVAISRVIEITGGEGNITGDLTLVAGTNVGIVQSGNTLTFSSTGGGGGGTASDTVVSEVAFGQSAAAGGTTDYSRGDHTHGSPATPLTSILEVTGGQGAITGDLTLTAGSNVTLTQVGNTITVASTDTTYTPAISVLSEKTFGLSEAIGSSDNYARQDHTHGTPVAPVTSVAEITGGQGDITGELTFSAGSNVQLVQTANTIVVSSTDTGGTPATTVESGVAFDQSSAVGTDTEYARQDHNHGSPVTPITSVPEITGGQGVITGALTLVGGTNVTLTQTGNSVSIAATGGSSIDPATTVVDDRAYGQSTAVGTDTEYAREDHSHGSPIRELPSGGNTSTALVKSSGTNYDVEWGGGTVPSGGDTGNFLAKASGTDYDVEWFEDRLMENLTIDFTTADTAAEMQAAIDAVPKNLNGYWFKAKWADGTYTMTQTITFNGFYSGVVYPFGDDTYTATGTGQGVIWNMSGTLGGIVIKNCSSCWCRGFRIVTSGAWNTYAIQGTGCAVWSIYACSVDLGGTSLGKCFLGIETAVAKVRNCYVEDGEFGILYETATQGVVQECNSPGTSADPKYGLGLKSGSVMAESEGTTTHVTGTTADVENQQGWFNAYP